MQTKPRKINLLVVLTVLTFIFTKPAYAYVDPGTGVLLLQILAAIGVGIIFYFRKFISIIKNLFSRSK